MSHKYYNISNIHSGITENHTLSPQSTIKYIDLLYETLQPYKISQNILHLKLIDPAYDPSQPIINDIDGYICKLEYLNKNTWDKIKYFYSNKFRLNLQKLLTLYRKN